MRDTVRAGANVLLVQTNNATFGYTDESEQQLAISPASAPSSTAARSCTSPPSASAP